MSESKKVYTKVVFDMKQEELPVVEEQYYLYSGPWALCDEEDDGGEEKYSDAAVTDDLDSGGGGSEPSMAEIMQTLNKNLETGFGQLYNKLDGLGQNYSHQQDQHEEQPAPASLPDSDTLESMSRAELLATFADYMDKKFESRLKPVTERIDGSDARSYEQTLKAEVIELRRDNPDLNEWKDELIQIAKEIPGISVTRALKLARSENPDKAQTMKEQYRRQAEQQRQKAEGSKKRKPFFEGFKPQTGRTGKKQSMTPQDAAEESFREIFGDIDSIKGPGVS